VFFLFIILLLLVNLFITAIFCKYKKYTKKLKKYTLLTSVVVFLFFPNFLYDEIFNSIQSTMVNHCTPVVITVVNDTLFIASFISNLFISFFTSEIINAMMFMLIYLVLSFIAIFFKECYYVFQKCLQQNNV